MADRSTSAAGREHPETWASVAAFPDYLVSSRGRVFSLPRRVQTCRGATREAGGTYLAAKPDADGYPRVSFPTPEGKAYRRVHQLVADAFLSPGRTDQVEVRHLDGDPTHNCVDNLAWGTAQENAGDRDRHGRQRRGEATPSARLTAAAVQDIRRRSEAGESCTDIAAEYAVDRSTVRLIVRRRTWAHV